MVGVQDETNLLRICLIQLKLKKRANSELHKVWLSKLSKPYLINPIYFLHFTNFSPSLSRWHTTWTNDKFPLKPKQDEILWFEMTNVVCLLNVHYQIITRIITFGWTRWFYPHPLVQSQSLSCLVSILRTSIANHIILWIHPLRWHKQWYLVHSQDGMIHSSWEAQYKIWLFFLLVTLLLVSRWTRGEKKILNHISVSLGVFFIHQPDSGLDSQKRKQETVKSPFQIWSIMKIIHHNLFLFLYNEKDWTTIISSHRDKFIPT